MDVHDLISEEGLPVTSFRQFVEPTKQHGAPIIRRAALRVGIA